MIRWSHAALNCADLEATERFYMDWFGFRRANVFTVDGTRIVFLRLGDNYLELFGGDGVQPPAGARPGGDGPAAAGAVRHIAFQVDNVDELLARMGTAAPVSLGPLSFDAFIPGWRTVWVNDPDGVVVEISQGFRDLEDGPSR